MTVWPADVPDPAGLPARFARAGAVPRSGGYLWLAADGSVEAADLVGLLIYEQHGLAGFTDPSADLVEDPRDSRLQPLPELEQTLFPYRPPAFTAGVLDGFDDDEDLIMYVNPPLTAGYLYG